MRAGRTGWAAARSLTYLGAQRLRGHPARPIRAACQGYALSAHCAPRPVPPLPRARPAHWEKGQQTRPRALRALWWLWPPRRP